MEKQTNAEAILPLVVEMSDRTKLTVQPGDKWKAGYVTLSRVAQNKTGWRNVHISKRSFEKFAENLPSIDTAMKEKSIQYQLMLTRKQHVLTTRFQREGKETLHYLSFMHTLEEKDSLNGSEEMNHAKTINLTEAEFDVLKNNLEGILKVVRSKNLSMENYESIMIEGLRWLYRPTGERSSKICLNQRECEEDSRRHFQCLDNQPQEVSNYQELYDYEPVQVQRPTKLEVIEHIAYRMIVQELENAGVAVDDSEPPHDADVHSAALNLDLSQFFVFTKKVLLHLKYKQIYMTNELIQVFLYVQGLERVKAALISHMQPGQGKLYTRLLDQCFLVACEEMKNDWYDCLYTRYFVLE